MDEDDNEVELTSTYFHKEDLVETIRQTERLSRWSMFICLGITVFFIWQAGFDVWSSNDALVSILLLVGTIGGAILNEVYKCKAMLLKAELREIQRYGEVPYDPDLADILGKRRNTSRWWPF